MPEQGEDQAVMAIGLGADAEAFGKAFDLPGIEHRDPTAGIMQERRYRLVIDAGGFEHDVDLGRLGSGLASRPGEQFGMALGRVGDGLGPVLATARIAQPDAMQRLFADIDADDMHGSPPPWIDRRRDLSTD